MESVQDGFMNLARKLIVKTDELCEVHGTQKIKSKKGTDEAFCPVCKQEEIMSAEQEQAQQILAKSEFLKTKGFLERNSIILDETIKDASFDNFKATTEEERKAFNFSKNSSAFYKNGGKGNTILTGRAGTGKSHLAMAILKDFNEHQSVSAMFVSYTQLIRLIKSSFSDKSSRYTQENMLYLLSKPDLLVLDDIGSEKKTEFNEELLTDILETRTSTIITTNYNAKELSQFYNSRTVSRMLRGVGDKAFKFENIKDKRVLPF